MNECNEFARQRAESSASRSVAGVCTEGGGVVGDVQAFKTKRKRTTYKMTKKNAGFCQGSGRK